MKFLSEIIVLVAGIASRIVLTELFRWHISLRLPTAIGVGCCSALEKSRENLTSSKSENPDAIKQAVKCDMCKDIDGGPACVRACPTGAALRLSLKSLQVGRFMTHTSFLSHDRFKFLWVALGLGFLSGLLYIFHDPKEPPNGGTWLGYGLGTVGAVLILWLTYLGRRKRNFLKGSGTVKGWVSAHVYLGAALLIVGHCTQVFSLGGIFILGISAYVHSHF